MSDAQSVEANLAIYFHLLHSSTMIIVEPSSDQDERSLLKKDIEIGTTTVSPSAAPATAPL